MTGLALPSDAFRLGDLTVVPSLNRIVREGGEEDVEPRVMRVLAVLAQTPGEVVPRAALFDAVWADTVVNDEALTRAVSELRKVLAHGAPGAVETIRGTGYRLALPTHALEGAEPAGSPADPASPSARRFSLAGLAVGLAVFALAVALWAAWPGGQEPDRAEAPISMSGDDAQGDETSDDTLHLGSDSPYYRPGLSELGVYYDSTADTYFRFEPDAE